MHGLWCGYLFCDGGGQHVVGMLGLSSEYILRCDRCEYLCVVFCMSRQLQLAVWECDCHCLHL